MSFNNDDRVDLQKIIYFLYFNRQLNHTIKKLQFHRDMISKEGKRELRWLLVCKEVHEVTTNKLSCVKNYTDSLLKQLDDNEAMIGMTLLTTNVYDDIPDTTLALLTEIAELKQQITQSVYTIQDQINTTLARIAAHGVVDSHEPLVLGKFGYAEIYDVLTKIKSSILSDTLSTAVIYKYYEYMIYVTGYLRDELEYHRFNLRIGNSILNETEETQIHEALRLAKHIMHLLDKTQKTNIVHLQR